MIKVQPDSLKCALSCPKSEVEVEARTDLYHALANYAPPSAPRADHQPRTPQLNGQELVIYREEIHKELLIDFRIRFDTETPCKSYVPR
jgi:hypothetical protein